MGKKQNACETAEKNTASMLTAALEEELGEIPEASITIGELQKLEQQAREKKRRKTIKIISASAAAVVLCILAGFVLWPQAALPADAGRTSEQRIQQKAGAVVINDGDVEGDIGLTEIAETDWDKVGAVKQNYPQLCIPEYIPHEYAFAELNIEEYGSSIYEYKYTFTGKHSQEIIITQISTGEEEVNTSFIENCDKKIVINGEPVYIAKSQNRKEYAVLKETYTLTISVPDSLDQKEAVKIYQAVK